MFNCATCIIATYATALQKCTIHDTPDSNKYSMLNGNINNRYQRIELCLYICAKDEILHFVYIVQHIETGIYINKLHSQILCSKRKYHT